MKLKTTYKCWNKNCKEGSLTKYRLDFNELIERKENINHFDYCCPKCEKVIVCSNKKIKREED